MMVAVHVTNKNSLCHGGLAIKKMLSHLSVIHVVTYTACTRPKRVSNYQRRHTSACAARKSNFYPHHHTRRASLNKTCSIYQKRIKPE